MIVVMTHGGPGRLYAKDDSYKVSEIWEPFVGDNCPSLIGKPKLIFLQACRGYKIDLGAKVQFYGQGPYQSTILIPTMADVLVMYATFDGELLSCFSFSFSVYKCNISFENISTNHAPLQLLDGICPDV
jgi:Caspase domain